MMQRNVFFKVRLLIPLCLWCVRFRHNNHLVRKKTRFGLKYQIVMDFLSKISSFWRHELVWKLSSVCLQMLSCRHFTFPTILSASWYRLGCFFLTFPPPTLAFCVCKLKNVRKYKSMAMYRFKLCRGQNSFGPDGSHRAVTTSSLLRVDRLKWVTFLQPVTETWVLSAAHVLSISSGYSVRVLGHLNHFVFYDRCAFFFFRRLCEVFLVLLWKLGTKRRALSEPFIKLTRCANCHSAPRDSRARLLFILVIR